MSTATATRPGRRSAWRRVAIPAEHGGWGLTLEPVLLGLLVGFSWAGVAIGGVALLAFLARTPLKLALLDRHRDRTLPRTRLAASIAACELAAMLCLVAVAVAAAGWPWLAPLLVAMPCFAVELWFDMRSRSRRLTPELCGAVGITAFAASIVLADGQPFRLAVALTLIAAARAIASVPFVRAQIARLHHRHASTFAIDVFQACGVVTAVAAAGLEHRVAVGAVAVAMVAAAQSVWVRCPAPPAKVLGVHQMILGLTLVIATAIGVHVMG